MKPSFFQNEQLAELPFEARLLFIGLWCLADREGRLEDRPKRIKMHVFPADMLDVEPLLAGLAENGLIVRYESDGIRCIQIPNFLKHQRPHVKEAPSALPMLHDAPRTPAKVSASTNLGRCQHALNPESPFLNPECSLSERGGDLPAGLDLEAWNRYDTYRREIRKPIKPASVLAAQRKLAGFGADQAAVVEQTVAQGWTGLFDLKEPSNGAGKQGAKPRPSAVKAVHDATAEWARQRGVDPASI